MRPLARKLLILLVKEVVRLAVGLEPLSPCSLPDNREKRVNRATEQALRAQQGCRTGSEAAEI